MKFVLYVAAGVGIQEGRDNLVDQHKESEDDFARRTLQVLKQIRREKLRNKEEEDNETKENGLARVPHPARREDETKTDEKGDEGEQTKPNPQNGVMVNQINGLSDKKPREKVKGQEKIRQELRRPVLDKEKKIYFFPQWKPQQGVREEEEDGEEYLSEGEVKRPYIKLRKKQTIGRNRKETKEICIPVGDGEEYLSVGEDGRPCIK